MPNFKKKEKGIPAIPDPNGGGFMVPDPNYPGQPRPLQYAVQEKPGGPYTASSDTSPYVTNKNGYIYIEKKVVKNMDNYQSAAVTIGLCLPLNYTQQDLEAAEKNYKVQMEFIDTKMDEQVTVLMDPAVSEDWIDNLLKTKKKIRRR